MSKTKNRVIDDQNTKHQQLMAEVESAPGYQGLSKDVKDSIHEWIEVTTEAKKLFLPKFHELAAKDGMVGLPHISSAVVAMSQMVGSLISLIPDEAAQDSLKNAFCEGVGFWITSRRIEQRCRREGAS